MISSNKARSERQQKLGNFLAKFVPPEKRDEARRELGALIPEIIKCREIIKRNRKRRSVQQKQVARDG